MTARDDRFLLLFALANAGGVVAYAPLLTLLLPAKIAALAGNARVEWLGAATLAGAIVASLSNLAAGWASDVTGGRRWWAGAGLCLTVASYVPLHLARSPAGVVAAVIAFQAALNILLGPLAAWAADCVPDRRKGLLGGLLGAGPPLGALAGVVATLPALAEAWMPMAAVCAMTLALAAPLILLGGKGAQGERSDDITTPFRTAARVDLALLWSARLLVQVAGNLLFGFLFYYLQALGDSPSPAGVARLSAAAVLLGFPLALVFGRMSDRLGPRKPFLIAAAALAAAGLAIMGSAGDSSLAAVGFVLFGCGNAVFLALHATFTMQVLPSPKRRGRDLGVQNLANTLPAVIAPLLAIWIVPGHGFGTLLAILTALVLAGGYCVLLVRENAPPA